MVLIFWQISKKVLIKRKESTEITFSLSGIAWRIPLLCALSAYSTVVESLRYYYFFCAGYVNMMTISSKDLHMKNSTSKADSQIVTIEPSKLS